MRKWIKIIAGAAIFFFGAFFFSWLFYEGPEWGKIGSLYSGIAVAFAGACLVVSGTIGRA